MKKAISLFIVIALFTLAFPITHTQASSEPVWINAQPLYVGTGQSITVYWYGLDTTNTAHDSIRLHKLGTTGRDYYGYANISSFSGEVSFPIAQPGVYRYGLYDDNMLVAESNIITVVQRPISPTITVNPIQIQIGSAYVVSWEFAGNQPHWFGIYPVGTWHLLPGHGQWVYGNGSQPLVAPKTPGVYIARLYDADWRLIDSYIYTVYEPSSWRIWATVTLCPGTYVYHGSGLQYAHEKTTQVAISVQIINTRRWANGKKWWDIRLPNIPGGWYNHVYTGQTGWIRESQARSCYQ